MIIHGKGWKGDRDRAMLLKMYNDLMIVFREKRMKAATLAAMDNWKLHRYCKDIYAQKTAKEIRWFNQVTGRQPLTKEFRWRLFWWNFFHPIPFVKKVKIIPVKPEPPKGIPFANA